MNDKGVHVYMNIDAVFSGGGVKAFAFIGVLKQLAEQNYSIIRVGGTSAGAIIASLLAANYRAREIERIFTNLEMGQFLDAPIFTRKLPPLKLLSLYMNKGLYKGDRFETWLAELLAKRKIVTFADIPEDSLKIVVSDITKGRLVVIPDDLERLYHLSPHSFRVAT